ncbi:hypothetical protein GCM10010442_31210 [Kitasatospora kifunensis]
MTFDTWTGRGGESIEGYMKNFADLNIPGDAPNGIPKLTPGALTLNPDSGGRTWRPNP